MNDTAKTIGLVEFIRLFTLPGEPEEPVTLEGKAWDAEMDMEVPSGEMMTWRPKHPPRPRLQIVPGSNPPSLNEVEVRTAWELPRIEEGEVQTAWDRAQGRCVFVTHCRQEDLQPGFVVDEHGVRSLLPDVAEMEALHLSEEEKLVILEEVEAVNLTWPVSLNEVRAWAERMDYELASMASQDEASPELTPPAKGRPPDYAIYVHEVEQLLAERRKKGERISQAEAIRAVIARRHPMPDATALPTLHKSIMQHRESLCEPIRNACTRSKAKTKGPS